MYFNYKELGQYPSKCPERNNKANPQGSMKKDLSMITCFKYNKKTPKGVANVEAIIFNHLM
jgi:hypothetical protein